MLYLSQPLNQSKEKQSSEDSSHKLTPLCQHGPKGRCIHCDAAPIGYKPSGKCTHGFGATCPNCSEHVKSQSTEIAPWLCNHPDYAFCPKCQPPEDEDEIKAKENEKLKVKFIPYAQLMAEKRALCKFKHDDSKTCLSCSPPVELSYKGNYNCRNGHRPWPLGMCSKCRPPNAVIRMQKYRHCDGISFKDISAGERFSSLWLGNPGLQRAGLLFGNVSISIVVAYVIYLLIRFDFLSSTSTSLQNLKILELSEPKSTEYICHLKKPYPMESFSWKINMKTIFDKSAPQ